MNVHVARIAARHNRDRLDRFLATCLTALFLGLLGGVASHAQEPFSTSVGIGNAGFPIQGLPQANFATGTTAGATATLPAAAAQFEYLCGFHVEVGSATAAIPVTITITGLKGGTFTTSANAPVTAATATAGPIVAQTFSPCLPSSGINVAIAVAASALGAGGVNQNVNVWGFQQ